jgi:hypothetical protein
LREGAKTFLVKKSSSSGVSFISSLGHRHIHSTGGKVMQQKRLLGQAVLAATVVAMVGLANAHAQSAEDLERWCAQQQDSLRKTQQQIEQVRANQERAYDNAPSRTQQKAQEAKEDFDRNWYDRRVADLEKKQADIQTKCGDDKQFAGMAGKGKAFEHGIKKPAKDPNIRPGENAQFKQNRFGSKKYSAGKTTQRTGKGARDAGSNIRRSSGRYKPNGGYVHVPPGQYQQR